MLNQQRVAHIYKYSTKRRTHILIGWLSYVESKLDKYIWIETYLFGQHIWHEKVKSFNFPIDLGKSWLSMNKRETKKQPEILWTQQVL